mmetsp:Transcript_1190/g.3737  ORF Transcript_1190/g.3737 Transcript_1190/m.3737 type:complete len:465 (-) Transcript_1190:305-1699(-)
MMTLFYLMGLFSFLLLDPTRRACTGFYSLVFDALRCGVVLLCCLAAVLCKETGVTLPFLCATWQAVRCMHGFWGPKRQSPLVGLRRSVAVCLVLVCGMVAVALLRSSWNEGPAPDFFHNANRASRIPARLSRSLALTWLWVEHGWALVYPVKLCVDWGADTIPILVSCTADARCLFLAGAILVLLGVGAVLLHRIVRGLSGSVLLVLGLGFPILTFVPSGNVLVHVGATKAERWLYLPSYGFCFLLACVLAGLADSLARLVFMPRTTPDPDSRVVDGGGGCSSPRKTRRAAGWIRWTLTSIILVLYHQRTASRDREWGNNLLLWRSAERVAPRNAQVLKNLGGRYFAKGATSTAIAVLTRGWELSEVDRGVHDPSLLLTVSLLTAKRYDQARTVAKEGIDRVSRLPTNFGDWKSEQAKLHATLALLATSRDEAQKQLQEAQSLDVHMDAQLHELVTSARTRFRL